MTSSPLSLNAIALHFDLEYNYVKMLLCGLCMWIKYHTKTLLVVVINNTMAYYYETSNLWQSAI